MTEPSNREKLQSESFPLLQRTADPLLFTPGPLSTSRAVKQAMLCDVGTWDKDFAAVVASVRRSLLQVAGVSQEQGFEAILMQGQRHLRHGSRGRLDGAPGRKAPGPRQRGVWRAFRQDRLDAADPVDRPAIPRESNSFRRGRRRLPGRGPRDYQRGDRPLRDHQRHRQSDRGDRSRRQTAWGASFRSTP